MCERANKNLIETIEISKKYNLPIDRAMLSSLSFERNSRNHIAIINYKKALQNLDLNRITHILYKNIFKNHLEMDIIELENLYNLYMEQLNTYRNIRNSKIQAKIKKCRSCKKYFENEQNKIREALGIDGTDYVIEEIINLSFENSIINEIERFVLIEHFVNNKYLSDIGRSINLSKERIRQIKNKGVIKINKSVKNKEEI